MTDASPDNVIILPNRIAMSSHLYRLFPPMFVHPYPNAWIEIAYALPDEPLSAARAFSAFELGPAVEFAEAQNRRGYNVYVGAALRQGVPGTSGRASDAHFLAASHVWVDADKNYHSIRELLRAAGLQPAIAVITGTVPEVRVQLYFRVPDNLAGNFVARLNRELAARLGSDEVSNPSRVLRLCGSVSYPSAKKVARGYIPELVAFDLELMPRTGEEAPLLAIERLLPAAEVVDTAAHLPAQSEVAAGFGQRDPYIDFAAGHLSGRRGREDQELYDLLRNSQTLGCWHNSVRDAIATMVGRGWEEAAIRLACAPYCQRGANDPDLDPLIEGAFKKWGRPDQGEPAGEVSSPDPAFPLHNRGTGPQRAPQEAPSDLYEGHWHDATAEVPDQAFLIRDLLPETGTGLMSGQNSLGKSYVALDLAGSVATGLPFAGNEICRRGGVLWVAAEGGAVMLSRLWALVEHKLRPATDPFVIAGGGTPLPEGVDLDRLAFHWIDSRPNVQAPRDHARLLRTVKARATEMLERHNVPLVLIVVDTVTQVGQFKDANDAAEAQRVFSLIAEYGAEIGAFVLAVDHFGKDITTGTRGSSVREDYVDVVLAITGDREGVGAFSNHMMTLRKSRVASAGTEFSYTLELVMFEGGGTSRVVIWKERRASEPIAGGGRVKVPKPLRMFRTIMETAVLDQGKELRPYGEAGPRVRAVTYETLRRAFTRAYPAESSQAKGQAFRRALSLARSTNFVCSEEINGVDYLWLVTGDPAIPPMQACGGGGATSNTDDEAEGQH